MVKIAKIFFILLIPFFLLSGKLSWADNWKIIKYDVYPKSAAILIEADTDGNIDITLPGTFPPDMIQPVYKTGSEKITSFTIRQSNSNILIPEFLEQTKANIDELSAKIEKIKNERSGCELANNITNNADLKNIKINELEQYIKTLSSIRKKSANECSEKDKQLKELEKNLKILTDEYNKKMPANFNNNTVINVKTEGKGKIYIKAETPYASWKPIYNMNLITSNRIVKSEMTAEIKQHTGINWKGDIEIHSNMPNRDKINTTLPYITVNIKSKRPEPRNVMALKEMAAAEPVMYDAAADTTGNEESVYFSESLLNINIKTKGTVTGDNIPSAVLLKQSDIKADISYQAIPEHSEKAYIAASIKSPEFMISGDVKLYVDGEYSGQSYISEKETGSAFSIPFGNINGIKISKKAMITHQDSSIFKGKIYEGYSIEATNNLKNEITLLVTDRVPISADSKISVETTKVSPKPLNIENGIHKWELKIKPNTKETITQEYVIKYPSDENIEFRTEMGIQGR